MDRVHMMKHTSAHDETSPRIRMEELRPAAQHLFP